MSRATLAPRATRGVRAWNVRVGDRLSFYDTKRHRERTMVVETTDHSFPGVVQLSIRARKGAALYRWNMKRAAIVRVRRAG